MKQNYLKVILLCLCLLTGINASAYDAEINGIYYNFSGDEAIVTYEDDNYNSYSGDVVIPASVIYNNVTYRVTTIGHYAFSGCPGLTSLTIPNSVTSIGEDAFSGSRSLTSIHISDLTAWCKICFDGAPFDYYDYAHFYLYLNGEEVKDLVIPEEVTSIGNYAFEYCTSLTSITIPNCVTSIGNSAFEYCTSLTSVTIGNSVTSIGYYAFEYCTSLTSVTIPNSVTSINNSAFYGCYFKRESFVNNSTLTSDDNWGATLCDEETNDGLLINENLVVKCRLWTTSVIIPSSVTGIGGDAFRDCIGLTSVTIPSSVTSIGYNAFRGCISLTFVTIPNSVTSIRDYAFFGCTGLTSVTIPNSVTSIGGGAFFGCKLRNVLVKCTTPPSGAAFSQQTLYHTTLYVPVGCWDVYAYDNSWYQFINIRETAMAEEQVSEQQAYTLMDANTFTYSVYDPVNDCIGTIKSVSGIDENNPNHSWQMIEAGGARYLYNIGAKKYVKKSSTGFELTSTPEPIEVSDSDNGLILGEQADRQWALVSNERMSASQSAIDEVTAIKSLFSSSSNGEDVFDLSGRKLDKPQTGINLIRMSDGTTKKVMVK